MKNKPKLSKSSAKIADYLFDAMSCIAVLDDDTLPFESKNQFRYDLDIDLKFAKQLIKEKGWNYNG